ncbi:MAG: PocR ligand-binding domain-containing protein [Oscillospiraceae bacterium]
MKNLKLIDLISPSILQQFQDGFSKFTGLAALITDENGVPVTVGSGFTDFCTNLTRKSEKGEKRCEECDKNGALQTLRNGKPAVYRCHAGLVDFASPIMVGGKFIGSIIGGQVRTSSIDREAMAAIAKELDIDPDAYIAAAERTAVLSVDTVERSAEYLYEIAKILSEMAYNNYLALSQSRKLERAARSQSAYIMNMSLNMEKNVSDWMSIAKEAVSSGDRNVMESSIRELISKSSDVYSMVGDTVDYIRMAGGEVELNENVYDLKALLSQVSDSVKDIIAEKNISLFIRLDGSVPQYMLGDSGKIGQILNKLIIGCSSYSEKTTISVDASCRKRSYASILDIKIDPGEMNIPPDVLEEARYYFMNMSAGDIINGETGSDIAVPLIGLLTKQLSGSIEIGSVKKDEPFFRLSFPQLEVNN